MRYKLLGRSGLRVSEFALGTMTFGQDWGWGCSQDEAKAMFDAFAEAGGNFIDTANRYTNGTSEQYVGEFIAADRDHWVVATKYSLFDRHGDPSFSGNHRKNMVRSLESSLRRLQTDHIDLFWVHAWDFLTPVDEIMRGLDDLVRAGKVLYVGISDTPAWIISQANTLADLRGWTPFVALQIRYSLADRAAERDLLPMARAFDLAVTPWSILGAGVLTGKYSGGGDVKGRATRWRKSERDLAIGDVVVEVANELGRSPSQVAINWVRQQPGLLIPLLGASALDQLQDNLAALDFTLGPEQIDRLERASKIDLGFPHDFLSGDEVRNLVTGGTFHRVDNHRR